MLDVQERKPSLASTFQVFSQITLANIPLAKASYITEPESQGEMYTLHTLRPGRRYGCRALLQESEELITVI